MDAMGGRGDQVAKLKHPFPLSPFVRRMMARGESTRASVRDRKLVKSGGQTRGTVRRAIRCRIYKERRRDLCRTVGYLSVSMAHAISLHGYRYVLGASEAQIVAVLFPFPRPLFLFFFPHIFCFIIGAFFLSFFLYLLGETWLTWGHPRGGIR